jgi:glutathione S-transferase
LFAREKSSGQDLELIDLKNPLFATYVIAATLMILKAVAMSWLTVVRMMKANGGFRAPEDLKKTPLNPNPNPDQTKPNEYVERVRRIQLNDLENLPFFLIAGFLYILTSPPLGLAQGLFYGYVASRLLHFAAYVTGQVHEVRALFWSIGSFILIFMTAKTLLVALGF